MIRFIVGVLCSPVILTGFILGVIWAYFKGGFIQGVLW